MVCDPVADVADVKKFYGIEMVSMEDLKDLDCLIIAVAHDEFKGLSNADIAKMFKNEPNESKVIIDVKGVRSKKEFKSLGYRYWRL